jgi:hypothetical protein
MQGAKCQCLRSVTRLEEKGLFAVEVGKSGNCGPETIRSLGSRSLSRVSSYLLHGHRRDAKRIREEVTTRLKAEAKNRMPGFDLTFQDYTGLGDQEFKGFCKTMSDTKRNGTTTLYS